MILKTQNKVLYHKYTIYAQFILSFKTCMVEATEMDALRRSSRMKRKDRIRNVTIRQKIGLERKFIKKLYINYQLDVLIIIYS